MKNINIYGVLLLSSLLIGCATAPLADLNVSQKVKTLPAPSYGKSGIYIFGGSQPYDLWLNGKCLGTAGQNGFFYEEVDAGRRHIVSTDNMMIPDHLALTTEAGKFYYVDQYAKLLSVYALVQHTPSDLRQLDASVGQQQLQAKQLVQYQPCKKPFIQLPQ